MHMWGRGWIACLLLAASLAPATAQTGRPAGNAPSQRGRGVLDSQDRPGGAAPTEGLDMTFEFVGGYDENEVPDGQVPTEQELAAIEAGYTSAATATLRFGQGRRANKYFRSTASGSLGYQQLGTEFEAAQTLRADVALQTSIPLGRRSSLTGAGGAAWEPSLLYGPFSALEDTSPGTQADPVDPSTATGPLSGIIQQRWLGLNGTLGVSRNWTSRQRMEVQYVDSTRRPISGDGFESRSKFVRWMHTWNARERNGFEASYRFGETRQTVSAGVEQPIRMQAADLQWRFTVRRSPRRGLSAAIGGGLDQTLTETPGDGERYSSVLPTVFGSLRFDISQNWSATVEGRRQASVLQGVALEPFSTRLGAARLDGVVGQRLRLSLTAAYSVGESRSRQTGSFEAGLGAIQLQYGFGRHVGLVADVSFYTHQLTDLGRSQPSFPTSYQRNSVRVGLTFWLPVRGTY